MQGRGIHRRLRFEVTPRLLARFWSKVERREADDCWEWQAALRRGYGAIAHVIDGKSHVLSAHVVSYVIHHGELPDGHVVRHTCDNRPCVNPGHLISGTPTENYLDALAAGSIVRVRGEQCARAKMTEADVRNIHAVREVTGMGAVRISRMLGLTFKQVEHVLSGNRWRHVPIPTTPEAAHIVAELTT